MTDRDRLERVAVGLAHCLLGSALAGIVASAALMAVVLALG